MWRGSGRWRIGTVPKQSLGNPFFLAPVQELFLLELHETGWIVDFTVDIYALYGVLVGWACGYLLYCSRGNGN
jgi:hypothetical protein